MSIIVKLKVDRQLTAAYWAKQALGTTDSYGNPFRIIKLTWKKNYLHKNADYAKTRGFEDAIIQRDEEDGGFKVTYRRNGCVQWQKPAGGVGPFYGEVACTPYNLKKLISSYGDKLWDITDAADIDRICRDGYEKLLKSMSPQLRAFNEKRINSLHISDFDLGKLEPEIPDIEKSSIRDEKQQLANQRAELDKRAAELDIKEKNLEEKHVNLVSSGVAAVKYSEDFLKGRKLNELRRTAKELGIAWKPDDSKDIIIESILNYQDGKTKQEDIESDQKDIENNLDA